MTRIGTHRITIFTGHFGSGKTEMAMGEALRSIQNEATTIVDLDTVNVFLRTSEATQILTEQGIQVLSPRFAVSQLDIPALTPQMDGAFYRQDSRLIVDIGGDESGARVLGRYRKPLMEQGYDFYLVANINRPFTRDRYEIREMAEEIQNACGLRITGLINNTHMMEETTVEDILKGQEEVEAAAAMLGVEGPVLTACMPQWIPESMKDSEYIIQMKPILHAPWKELD